MTKIILRGRAWIVREQTSLGSRVHFRLQNPATSEVIEALCPPDEFERVPEPAPSLDKRSLTPLIIWRSHHVALRLRGGFQHAYAAFLAARISPEAYQFAPLARLLDNPRRSLLIADDVGLGKTIEAGICLLELIARGAGKRILLVVPPGLIPQWLDEMWEKFGLEFHPIENSASLDKAQTTLSEGIHPWTYFDRVITSVEYLKRRDIHAIALARPWDIIVVDEAHYIAESGTPANPYSTARTRLGPKLSAATRSLLLLTATPHNGYRHSFRSLLELVNPADASLHGDVGSVARRVGRSMIRRLKPQIVRSRHDGSVGPAFPIREPVGRIEIDGLSDEEVAVFDLVSAYCRRTLDAAEGSEEADLVSFAMQIIKKRMLSSRAALHRTVENRLDALASRKVDEAPTRAEIRELQGDLPLEEAGAERTRMRILRSAVSRDARRREAEKRQLKEIQKRLDRVAGLPDPKISALISDLQANVVAIPGEKAIVFTEYRDTLAAIRDAFQATPSLRDSFAELTGGLSSNQRKARIVRFHDADWRILLATDAASEGLNLQKECRRLYHVELPWNPNRLEQRNGRIDRHGQTRSPIIKYLFYPKSPEDVVLDRLVERISHMHDDRVSTPDILGIVEGSRIEEILGRITSLDEAEAESQSLVRLFDSRQEEFAREIAPLLLAGNANSSALPYANAVSADPMLEDDGPFEVFMLEILGNCAKAGRIEGTWIIDVPRDLLGAGVAPRYPFATFRRSVAVRIPASEVEFVHRLHPLFRAIADRALHELTIEPRRHWTASRIAVRRHREVKQRPIAIFTFLDEQSHPAGVLLAIALAPDGSQLDDQVAVSVIDDDSATPGEVAWQDVEAAFGSRFAQLQSNAADAALRKVGDGLRAAHETRMRVASVLREDAALYRVDRLAEIELEERAEQVGSKEQMDLFREAATDWQARRAAVETHYCRRLEEIEQFTQQPEPRAPQPLGALLLFPEG